MTDCQTRRDGYALAEELTRELTKLYGPILTGDALRKALGYRSMEAMRQAVSRGTFPVVVFTLANRRGRFALARDVANWLAEQRNRIETNDDSGNHQGGDEGDVT